MVCQLLTESILLALLGGLAGVAIAAAGIRFLLVLLTNGSDDFSLRVGLDWRVLLFTLGIALMTGLLFGLAPALQATRVDIIPALKEARGGEGHCASADAKLRAPQRASVEDQYPVPLLSGFGLRRGWHLLR